MARILIVDEDHATCELLAAVLGRNGHRVEHATDGAAALATAHAEPPDLIVTDLLMPRLGGYELIRAVRTDPDLAATPAIFYTAPAIRHAAEPIALTLDVHHVLAEPVDSQSLLHAVEQALARPVAAAEIPAAPVEREHLRALVSELLERRDHASSFRSLAESLPVGVFSLVSATQSSYANPRLLEMCGLAPNPPTVRWDAVVHPADIDRLRNGLTQVIDDRLGFEDRVRLVRSGAEPRWVRIKVAALAPAERETSGLATVVGTVEDITEPIASTGRHTATADRPDGADRLDLLGQLSGNVAHDFNNLLAVIVDYADYVSNGLRSAASSYLDPRWEQMEKDLAAVRATVRRATHLTDQLLVFARRPVPQTDLVDLNEVVSDAVTSIGSDLGTRAQLRQDLGRRISPVMSDRALLRQVLLNLVANARDAVADGGTIVIGTASVDLDASTAAALYMRAEPDRYVRLTVTDDGVGMTAETAIHAFEPFFTTKHDRRGAGFGLAAVYGIVRGLGGAVGLESRPGAGTTVSVYLPIVDAVVPDVAETVIVTAGAGEVILVSEDDEEIRAVLGRILTENGYLVVDTDRGTKALDVLADTSQHIDLLLTDVVMPEMSGREVAERAARLRPALPVLFVSGYASGLLAPGGLLEHREIGARKVEILAKPFTQTELLAAVSRSLQHARARSERPAAQP